MSVPEGFTIIRKEWLPIIAEIDRRAGKEDGRNYDFTVTVQADEYRAADDADRNVSVDDFRPTSQDEEIAALRARVAELEEWKREAEKQEPICYKVFTDGGDYVYVDDGVPCGYPAPNILGLYTRQLPAPVAAVPDDGSYLRPAVALFARRMEDVLRENDHKGGWQGLDKVWLHARLLEEARELETAIRYGGNRNTKHDHAILVANEAADVANFAMMIADNAMRAASIESHPLHTSPAVSQIGQDAVHNDERKAAEHEYVIRAFDYKENPIGSRDWILFWNGWSTRAMLAASKQQEQK